MTTMTWLASQPMICVKYLLESYSDGHTPLHTAVRKNTLDVVKGTICQIIIISKNLIFWRVIGGGIAILTEAITCVYQAKQITRYE